MNENQAFGRVIRFWMRKVRDLRIELVRVNSAYADLLHDKLDRANSDYADLLQDFSELNDLYLQAVIDRCVADQRIEELEDALGRREDCLP